MTHKILLMILITCRLKVVYNFSLVKHNRASEIQQSRKNPRTRDTRGAILQRKFYNAKFPLYLKKAGLASWNIALYKNKKHSTLYRLSL